MMHLRITHDSFYDYSPVVETAHHMLCLHPVDTAHQQVLSHHLDILPAPAECDQRCDVYGNHRSFFAMDVPHESLRVVAASEVSTQAPLDCDSSLAWELARERFRYRAGAAYDAASEFMFASTYVPRDENFAAYARPSFRPGTHLVDAARDLMLRIHGDFTYAAQTTDVSTPAGDVLEQRMGVCQDFAHVMLACMRAMGIPARYVSGYLLSEPPPGRPRLIGADASHAWVSVYVPDLPGAREGRGWYDLDPTNAHDGWGTPGEDYVTLAIGRDYADVSPIRGVIHGGAEHVLTVGVTVEPVEIA